MLAETKQDAVGEPEVDEVVSADDTVNPATTVEQSEDHLDEDVSEKSKTMDMKSESQGISGQGVNAASEFAGADSLGSIPTEPIERKNNIDFLMDIPLDVAAEARPTLQILSFWPLPIAWRRAHQGVLIRAEHTTTITAATGIRLATLAAGIVGGLFLFPWAGAVVAGIAMDLSVVVEAVVITLATRRILRSPAFQPEPAPTSPPLTLRAMWRFYRPLAMSTILRQFTRPVLSAGIAAAAMPRESLAAWPVAWGLVILITGPAWSLQQLTTALATSRSAFRRVRNFALTLSALFGGLLALVAFTPLYEWVMGGIYRLSGELQALALPATQLLVVLPLLMGAQSLLRGVLIRTGYTGEVRTAMALNVMVLVVTLLLGVSFLSLTGTLLAALATVSGSLAELAWLYLKSRPSAF